MNINPADRETLSILSDRIKTLSSNSLFAGNNLLPIANTIDILINNYAGIANTDLQTYLNKYVRQPLLDLYNIIDANENIRKNALFPILIALCKYWPFNDSRVPLEPYDLPTPVCYISLSAISEEQNRLYLVSGHIVDRSFLGDRRNHPVYQNEEISDREIDYYQDENREGAFENDVVRTRFLNESQGSLLSERDKDRMDNSATKYGFMIGGSIGGCVAIGTLFAFPLVGPLVFYGGAIAGVAVGGGVGVVVGKLKTSVTIKNIEQREHSAAERAYQEWKASRIIEMNDIRNLFETINSERKRVTQVNISDEVSNALRHGEEDNASRPVLYQYSGSNLSESSNLSASSNRNDDEGNSPPVNIYIEMQHVPDEQIPGVNFTPTRGPRTGWVNTMFAPQLTVPLMPNNNDKPNEMRP